MEFLGKLSNADALAGQEAEVRNLMHQKMKGADDVSCDNLGSLICKLDGTKPGPKIMFAAHMDEVGFIVRYVAEGGQIFVKPMGAVLPLAKFMQAVRITNSKGEKIKGYLYSTYTEDKPNTEIPGETYVDVGAKTAKEVEALGIEIGNIVCFDSQFSQIGKNVVMGKAFDDRIGCYILSRVFENLKKAKHPNTVYFTATSSEEVGTRGAQTSALKINPDVAFVVDCCCYKDEFDRSAKNKRQIGNGMILTHSDRGQEFNQELLKFIKSIAKKLNKNLQLDMFARGATDGMKIHLNGEGVPTAVCCVPLRYGHCSYSLANKKDIEDTIAILTEVFKNLDDKKFKSFLKFI